MNYYVWCGTKYLVTGYDKVIIKWPYRRSPYFPNYKCLLKLNHIEQQSTGELLKAWSNNTCFRFPFLGTHVNVPSGFIQQLFPHTTESAKTGSGSIAWERQHAQLWHVDICKEAKDLKASKKYGDDAALSTFQMTVWQVVFSGLKALKYRHASKRKQKNTSKGK